VPFLRTLGWVALAASLEVIVVGVIGFFFGGGLARTIMVGMGGMRNSPEEDLLIGAVGYVWMASWFVLLMTAILITVRYEGSAQPLPRLQPGRVPWRSLLLLTMFWIAIAVPAQEEQRRFITHAKLMQEKDYAGALNYLSQHKPSDFPPSRRLEPNPYEYNVWKDLPPTFALITSNTPRWIRETYLFHLQKTFRHSYALYDSMTDVAQIYSSIEQLPEGRNWLLTNQDAVASRGLFGRMNSTTNEVELTALSNLVATFSRMGMAQSNLDEITK
jgi:hypothetical protein